MHLAKRHMGTTRFLNRYLLTFLFLSLLIIFVFHGVFHTFYQQDEWLGMGEIASQGWQHIISDSSPLGIIFGENRPFVRILGLIFFGRFSLDITPLAIYSLVWHFFNSFLVFLIADRLFKKYILSITAATFFALNSVHSQAIIWFGASFGLMPMTFFIFLSLYLLLLFFETNKLKYLYLAYFFTLVSLYFKESGLFLLIFIPLFAYIYTVNKKKHIISIQNFKNKKIYGIFILYLILFLAIRLFNQVSNSQSGNILVTSSTVASNLPLQVTLNAFIYSLSSIFFVYFPSEITLPLAIDFTKLYFPYLFQIANADLIIQNIILLAIGVFWGTVLLTLIIFIFYPKTNYKLNLVFIGLIFIASIFPYFVITKSFAYLEPRYYYITSLSAGLLFGIILDIIVTKIKYKKIGYMVVLLMLFFYFFMHFQVIQKSLNELILISQERIRIIQKIYEIKPNLNNKKNIVYVTGNRDYVLPENKLPFQQGVGYTIMVMYYKDGEIPKTFLNEAFLWNLGSQGYKEINGTGFGYFTSLNDLKKTIKKYQLSKANIIAIYYDDNKKEVINIIDKIALE